MPLYENVFIARQDVSAQQVEGMTEEFGKLIGENGGEVAKSEYWGVRSLAYRIKKNRKGHYVMMNVDAPSEAVQEMERNMRLHEDIIRYMTVRVDELEEGPSAMMQSRGRGGRGGRDRDGRDRDNRDRDNRDRDNRGRDEQSAAKRDGDAGSKDAESNDAESKDAAKKEASTEE